MKPSILYLHVSYVSRCVVVYLTVLARLRKNGVNVSFTERLRRSGRFDIFFNAPQNLDFSLHRIANPTVNTTRQTVR